MRIDEIELSNFRGFTRFSLRLHPECTVIAGVNGAGKSTVLDGLAVAAGAWFLGFNDAVARGIGNDELRRVCVRHEDRVDLEYQYPSRVEANGNVDGKRIHWARERASRKGKTTRIEAKQLTGIASRFQKRVQSGADVTLPVVAYYGTGRLWAQLPNSKKREEGLDSRIRGYEDALDPRSNHKLFTAWMRDREYLRLQKLSRSRPTAAAIAAAHDEHMEAVAIAAARLVADGAMFRYDIAEQELRLEFRDGTEQSFDLLADGYRNLVALAADIAWRSVRLNPHLGAKAPAETSGVVLIDEVALHLHPAWQRTIVPRLRETFPLIQFVVTTHSPVVIGSVPPECVRFLEANGAARTPDATHGIDVNGVLERLMGVEAQPDVRVKLLGRIERALDSGELDAARSAIDELRHVAGGSDPAVTEALAELHAAAAFADDA